MHGQPSFSVKVTMSSWDLFSSNPWAWSIWWLILLRKTSLYFCFCFWQRADTICSATRGNSPRKYAQRSRKALNRPTQTEFSTSTAGLIRITNGVSVRLSPAEGGHLSGVTASVSQWERLYRILHHSDRSWTWFTEWAEQHTAGGINRQNLWLTSF